jgi:hypothetical protein
VAHGNPSYVGSWDQDDCRTHVQNNQSKMFWRLGSSSRVPAWVQTSVPKKGGVVKSQISLSELSVLCVTFWLHAYSIIELFFYLFYLWSEAFWVGRRFCFWLCFPNTTMGRAFLAAGILMPGSFHSCYLNSFFLLSFFFSTEVWTQGLHLEPFFCDGFFQDRVLRAICLGWPQTTILLISAS